VNVATDRQRSRGAQARAFGAERVPEEEWERTTPDPGARPDTSAVRAEQRERIRQALDALPPKARTIIMLSDVEGLSYREIAEVLRCPIGTVMSRLHNARKRLKALLGPVLAVLLCLAMLLGNPARADAQQMIRFGVRVLYASNTPGSAPAPPPGSGPTQRPTPPPPPAPSATPPGAGPPQAGRATAPPPPSGHPAPPPPSSRPDGDERLRRILPQLRAVFRYTEYTPIERHRVDGPLGTAQRFSIPGDRWLEVTPDQLQGALVRMHVRLLRGDQPEMNASLLAAPGAPAIFGGPAYGSGVLIIILWVNPEPGATRPRSAPEPSVRSR
jgi:hypothetical protein